jgi:hypothetical protein
VGKKLATAFFSPRESVMLAVRRRAQPRRPKADRDETNGWKDHAEFCPGIAGENPGGGSARIGYSA